MNRRSFLKTLAAAAAVGLWIPKIGPLAPDLAHAAVAFNAATDGGNNGGSSSSLTFAHTCFGSDGLLIVALCGDTSADDISSVTYNGVGMTLLAKFNPGDTSNGRHSYFYYLLGPAAATNNVVVTAGSSHYLLAGASSYSGVNATGQPDASTSNTGSAQFTTSLTTIADNCWTMLTGFGFNSSGPPIAGTGATRRTYEAAFGTWGIFDSNAAITPPGSYSMTCGTTGNAGGHKMASFKPVGAAAPATNFFRRRIG
jgi:hypothetical protein